MNASPVPDGVWEADSAEVGTVRLASPVLTVAGQAATLDGTAEVGLLALDDQADCIVQAGGMRWHFPGRVTSLTPGVMDTARVESTGPIEAEAIA